MRKLWMSMLILVMTALVLSACGSTAPVANSSAPAVEPTQASAEAAQSAGMDHSADAMADTSYDVHFIDSTLNHHTAVLAMTQQALTESTNVTLKDLAQQSMTTTQKEIDWLKAYRQKNHADAAVMKDSMDMGAMSISTDTGKPFEQRYAEAMISHHQGCITMAKEALTKLGHDELKQFAQTMLAVEEAEVAQLQQFLK